MVKSVVNGKGNQAWVIVDENGDPWSWANTEEVLREEIDRFEKRNQPQAQEDDN